MPSAWAFAVIISAKRSSEPAMFSPMAQATSFADLVTIALIASSTEMVWPGRRPSFDGAWAAAWGVMVSSESRAYLPRSICSKSM